MALSQAWTHFFEGNTSGNSCLGPLAGLEKQRSPSTARAVECPERCHTDPRSPCQPGTTRRPQGGASGGGGALGKELGELLGITHQCLALNGWLEPVHPDDPVSRPWLESRRLPWKRPPNSCNLSQSIAPLAPTGQPRWLGCPVRLLPEPGPVEETVAPEEGDPSPTLPGLGGAGRSTRSPGARRHPHHGQGWRGQDHRGRRPRAGPRRKPVRACASPQRTPAAHLADAFGDNAAGLENRAHRPESRDRRPTSPKSSRNSLPIWMPTAAPSSKKISARPCTEEIAVFRAFARTGGWRKGRMALSC